MQERGLGPKTIANSHGLLSAGMESAIWQGWRTANPCKGIRLPKDAVGGDDATMVTYEDYRAIEAHMEDHYKPFFGFLVGTGMRFSEATALLASDFKLDAATPTVRVNKAHKQGAEGGRYVGPPKTRKGKRTISLAPSTVGLVRPLVESAGERTVFRMPAGGQMTAQAIFNRCWKPARAAAGLDKRVTIHSLRHLHAAMMLGAGMSMYDLSRRLGHNSITISVDLYSHLLPDAQFNGAQVAAKALEGF
jgi:integrase